MTCSVGWEVACSTDVACSVGWEVACSTGVVCSVGWEVACSTDVVCSVGRVVLAVGGLPTVEAADGRELRVFVATLE